MMSKAVTTSNSTGVGDEQRIDVTARDAGLHGWLVPSDGHRRQLDPRGVEPRLERGLDEEAGRTAHIEQSRAAAYSRMSGSRRRMVASFSSRAST